MPREVFDDFERGRGSPRDSDLVLLPGTFAYVSDTTKGRVSVWVGPYRNSLSNTDQLVVWDPTRGLFTATDNTANAIRTFVKAAEGQYIVLSDPADSDKPSPPLGTTTESVELNVGRQVIVPGPANFPLWPGQTAQVIDGHRLRSNQYVLVRVVQPDEARSHWDKATLAPAATVSPVASDVTPDETSASEATADGAVSVLSDSSKELKLTMGQLIVVKGTEVSFYMPSTGLEVVPDESGNYIREAATLERIEYCILLDESGDKRYVQGPAVVFPSPTETFVNRKARAIELNPESGLYIKVIADYQDGEEQHKVGEELFITGSDQAIYFPRHEHAIIKYDGRTKHHAIAIPAGDARYVLDKPSGKVEMVRGPRMYLPDPRTKVVVRRILDPRTVEVMYPGNTEAIEINRRYLREQRDAVDVQPPAAFGQDNSDWEQEHDDALHRGNTYTPPRTIVLDNKYLGAVAVEVWPGYAVMVTDKLGNRRVEVGPKSILLEYDESLMVLELSTGRPKSDDDLLRTVYLRTVNNTVGDIVSVETRDMVPVYIELSYRVDFEGKTEEERTRWFDIENYTKVLTDHCRSRLGNAAKRHSVQELYTAASDIVRDALLGDKPDDGDRPGLYFAQNGMKLLDVEVLQVRITDRNSADILNQATRQALSGAVDLARRQEEADRQVAVEELTRTVLEAREETAVLKSKLELETIQRNSEASAAELKARLEATRSKGEIDSVERAAEKDAADQRLAIRQAIDRADLARLKGEVQQYGERLRAVDSSLVAALREFGDQNFVESLVSALGPAALAAGTTPAELLEQVFEGTPFASAIEALGDRPIAKRKRKE